MVISPVSQGALMCSALCLLVPLPLSQFFLTLLLLYFRPHQPGDAPPHQQPPESQPPAERRGPEVQAETERSPV